MKSKGYEINSRLCKFVSSQPQLVDESWLYVSYAGINACVASIERHINNIERRRPHGEPPETAVAARGRFSRASRRFLSTHPRGLHFKT